MRNLLAAVLLLILAGRGLAADYVVVLLDTSSSMDTRMRGGSKLSRMEAAKESLITVIRQLPEGTNVGVVTFDGWAYRLQRLDKDAVEAAVTKIKASGGTPLGQYIKVAADELLEARQKQGGRGTYRLLVVTDGEASDSNLMNKHVPDVVGRGIILDTIGVDMSSDHALKRSAHKYMSADDPESLRAAVTTVLGEVGKIGRDDVGDFALLDGLTDDGAKAIIGGVTEFANYPIGEAYEKVTDPDGTTRWVPVSKPQDEGWGVGMWLLVSVGCLAVGGGVLLVVFANRRL